MNPAQQEILHNLQLLNQKAIDDFDVFFEQTGKKMCSAPHQSIAALSHLYCFSTSLNDLRLPLTKSYKFIFSSWVKAALYQVVHDGLKALNVVHEHLNKIASITSKIAEAMVRNIHCAVMLQDNPQLIVISPEFIENVNEVKKLQQVIFLKFQAINNLVAEVVETIKEANLYNCAVRDYLLLALADVSKGFNNDHLLWTWVSEIMDIIMSILNANRDNEIEIQTLSNAHKPACLAFQATVVFTICLKYFDLQLLNMDELVTVTSLSEVSNKQVEIQQSIAQFANTNNVTAQNMFKQYIYDSEDFSKAATSTMLGYLKITAVSAIFFAAFKVYAELDGLKSPPSKYLTSTWNYVFPKFIEFKWANHTAEFRITVFSAEPSDILLKKIEFVLSSSHLNSIGPVTLQKTFCGEKITVRVSTYKFKL